MKKSFCQRLSRIFLPLACMLTCACAPLSSNGENIIPKAEGSANKRLDPIAYESDVAFYDDDYFRSPSTVYNEHLATLSILMAKYSMNPGGPDNINDEEWYVGQSARIRHFMTKIGFLDQWINVDYKTRTGFDTIGIVVGQRKVDDATVLACAVRSGGYFLEWENNVFLGDGSKSDMMHEGWYNAAHKVISFLGDYIKHFAITGKIKLWLSGYSRGGAVMNLTAGILDNNIVNGGEDSIYEGTKLATDDLYAYTFEAPQGANTKSTSLRHPKDELYNNIFNVINPNDLVTKVGPSGFGFTRFGIDKFITNEFYDPANFKANRDATKALYALVHPKDEWRSDNLTPYGVHEATLISALTNFVEFATDVIDIIVHASSGELPDMVYVDDYKRNYNGNFVETLIFDKVMDSISSDRNWYCNNAQDTARTLMKSLFNDVAGDDAPTPGEILLRLVFQVIAYWAYGVVGGLIEELIVDTPVSVEDLAPILKVGASVFGTFPNEVFTLGFNIKDIFENHSTDVNVAHLEAQDSYYVDWYNQREHNQIQQVPLRSSASFYRARFIDFNDCDLYRNDESGRTHLVSVEGHRAEHSDMNLSEKGAAVGYYNYSDSERLEVFFPSCYSYHLDFTEYSLDIDHECIAGLFHYPSNSHDSGLSHYRTVKSWYDEYAWCDDGPYGRDISPMEDPE